MEVHQQQSPISIRQTYNGFDKDDDLNKMSDSDIASNRDADPSMAQVLVLSEDVPFKVRHDADSRQQNQGTEDVAYEDTGNVRRSPTIQHVLQQHQLDDCSSMNVTPKLNSAFGLLRHKTNMRQGMHLKRQQHPPTLTLTAHVDSWQPLAATGSNWLPWSSMGFFQSKAEEKRVHPRPSIIT